jgi:hypothetical protein
MSFSGQIAYGADQRMFIAAQIGMPSPIAILKSTISGMAGR